MAPADYKICPGSWFVQYSNRQQWHAKRNVHADAAHFSDSIVYTYQEKDKTEIKALTLKSEEWTVIARGKDGKLENWMIETAHGIEDKAGEVRADWRSTWTAIKFPPSTDDVEIWCNRQQRISDETLEEICNTIESEGIECRNGGGKRLLVVLDDGARNAEMKEAWEKSMREWEKRTGPTTGISEDLVYDDVIVKEDSRCSCQ